MLAGAGYSVRKELPRIVAILLIATLGYERCSATTRGYAGLMASRHLMIFMAKRFEEIDSIFDFSPRSIPLSRKRLSKNWSSRSVLSSQRIHIENAQYARLATVGSQPHYWYLLDWRRDRNAHSLPISAMFDKMAGYIYVMNVILHFYCHHSYWPSTFVAWIRFI